MHYEKYLGLPSLVRKSKKASFNYIKERVWQNFKVRKGSYYHKKGGKEMLFKSVIQAIPTYTM